MSRIKNPVDQRLQEVPFLILDGALATELEQKGFDLNDPLWSARLLIEAPEQIERVHHDYFEVGADVAITSSYQASIEGFKQRHITTEEAQALIRQTVTLAQDARTRSGKSAALIAGSVGPYGAYLADGSEYRGHYG
ncbi:MAG: homocysteine S-methyltransferase family protein, partial [Exiguobacterium sp.]